MDDPRMAGLQWQRLMPEQSSLMDGETPEMSRSRRASEAHRPATARDDQQVRRAGERVTTLETEMEERANLVEDSDRGG
jgi:hypothetical protein